MKIIQTDKRQELANILNCKDLPLLAKVLEAVEYFNIPQVRP